MKPANISFEQAAAATLAALTAYQALVKNANVVKGQRVLIHAAAGGVGHFGVQIAKHLGAHVTGTSSAGNRSFVLSLRADDHIDYKNHHWQQGPNDFDITFDAIGGDNLNLSLEVTRLLASWGLTRRLKKKQKAKV